MKQNYLIAIYFDLENVDKAFDLGKLMDAVSLNIEEELSSIFAIKLACGNEHAIAHFRTQLLDLNFNIREAPHVSEKNLKNRADLILSIEAFESLYQNNPEIDQYVFITSDTDFTVVMDKLRKYGKKVWLVTRRHDKEKKLFTTSTDKILVIDDYSKKDEKEPNDSIETELESYGFTKHESTKIREVINSFVKDQWHNGSIFGTKIRNVIKDFSYSGKRINSQSKLFDLLAKSNKLEVNKDDNKFKIIA
jgi:uncharacterized LabA/DUF88 family protein